MGYLILILLIVGVLVFAMIRGGAFLWRVLRNPEETRRIWAKYKAVLIGLAVVQLLVAVSVVIWVASYVGEQSKIGKAGFTFLTGKYGKQADFTLSFTSDDHTEARTNSSAISQLNYVIGTNAGVLTLERRTDEQGDVYYMVIRDDPRP